MNIATSTANAPQAMPSEAFLSNIVFGALMTQALAVAVELGIADSLAEKPKSVLELAVVANAHERALYRVLRIRRSNESNFKVSKNLNNLKYQLKILRL
jgi:hypothetical protein